MRFTNLTRKTEIGANCYLLEMGGLRIVLDAGLHPKFDGREALPLLEALDAAPVDAVLVSHAHMDHVGSLPVLARRHPHVPVYMTEATALLADVMLHNSVNVMTRERDEKGIPDYPLYSHREVDRARRHWVPRGLERPFHVAEERGGVTAEFFDAGHILGSAAVLLEADGRSVLYTGDINLADQSVCSAARLPAGGFDALIVETTRGDSPVPPGYTRRGEAERFAASVLEAFDRGGCVLAPCFALGKTQELLALIHGAQQRGSLPVCPLYIGGLARKVTDIYDTLTHRAKRLMQGFRIMDQVAPMVVRGDEAARAPIRPSRIYALSSGMMTEKTGSHLMARRILEDPLQSVFFVGYSDPDSPAGKLRAAGRGGQVRLNGAAQEVRCEVREFNFSGHSDRDAILGYILRANPKTVVLVHGDAPAAEWFRRELAARAPAMRCEVPEPGKPLDLL